MKKIIFSLLILVVSISTARASFMFQEIDPICSISGTTHTYFPGEVSDTSSWNIPKAYDGECDKTPELSQKKKEMVYNVMLKFFKKQDYIGPVYGENAGYGGNDTLNPEGQKFIKNKFFPAVIDFIEKERAKTTPNLRNIALVNTMVKTIGYDYFLTKAQ